MPVGTHLHDSPTSGTAAAATYSASNTSGNSPTPSSLPTNYAGAYSSADLLTWPSGGVLTTNTLEDLRKGTNQLASDFNTAIVSHQGQINKNAANVNTLDVRGDEMQADLINIATDLSNKAFDTITFKADTGLTIGRVDGTNPDGLAADTVNLKNDFELDLLAATTSALGGVRISTDTIANGTLEAAIQGHIEIDGSGYIKVKNNAIELGEKTRGDYIKNITATTSDGITLTNGTGEGSTTDLKLTELLTAGSAGSSTDAEETSAYTMPAGKIRKVLVPSINYNKFGQITSVSEVEVNSANNSSVTITAGNHLTTGGSFALNHGAGQTITIDHAAVSVQTDQTFTTDSPSSSEVKYRTTDILANIGFDAYGHVDSISKQELTYGLSASLAEITHNQYTRGDFHLNIPREADFKQLHDVVVSLKGDSILIPVDTNVPVEVARKLHIGGTSAPPNAWLRVDGDLSVGGNDSLNSPGDTSHNPILLVKEGDNRVGINTNAPLSTLDVRGQIRSNNSYLLDVLDGGGSPATTAIIDINGYEGRGAGIKIQDSINSASNPNNREWFIGSGYSQSGFNIGYSSTGVQSSYAANAKLAISTLGNVGIGTTTPATKLDVVGTITSSNNIVAGDKFRSKGAQDDNDVRMVFESSDGADRFQIHTNLNTTNTSDVLVFRSEPTDNIFVLKGDGNVGIGTESPGKKLDVNGSANISANLDVGGSVTITSDLNVGSNKFVVDESSGNVGIGAGATPDKDLDIANADVYIDDREVSAATTGHAIRLQGDPTTASGASMILYSNAHSSHPGKAFVHANEFNIRKRNQTGFVLRADADENYVVVASSTGLSNANSPAARTDELDGVTYGPYQFEVAGKTRLGGDTFVGGRLGVTGIMSTSGSVDLNSVSLDEVNNITMSGSFDSQKTDDATNSTTAPNTFAGGVGINKSLFVGTNLAAGGNTTLTGTLTVDGNSTIGNSESDSHTMNGSLKLQGNLTVGTEGSLTDENLIKFAGTTNDDSGDIHTVFAERIWDSTERSELLIFKGNDAGGASGPDRIRHRAGEHIFQTYTSSETYSAKGDNNTRVVINNDGQLLLGGHTTSLHASAGLQLSGSTYARIMLKDTDATNQHAFIDKTAAEFSLTSQNGSSHGTLALKTYNGTDTLTRLFVKEDGNVGIGTGAPSGLLHLKGDFETAQALKIESTYGTGTTHYFRTHGTDGQNLNVYSNNTRVFDFHAGLVSSKVAFEALNGLIVSSGNTGLGVATANERLEIAEGALRLRGKQDGQFDTNGDATDQLKRKEYIQFSSIGSQGALVNSNDGARMYAEYYTNEASTINYADTDHGSLVLEINDNSSSDNYTIRHSYDTKFINTFQSQSDMILFHSTERLKADYKEHYRSGNVSESHWAGMIGTSSVQFFTSLSNMTPVRQDAPGNGNVNLGFSIKDFDDGPSVYISKNTDDLSIPFYINVNEDKANKIELNSNGVRDAIIASGTGGNYRFRLITANSLDGSSSGTKRVSTEGEVRLGYDQYGRGFSFTEMFMYDVNDDSAYSHGADPNAVITLRRTKASADIAFQGGTTANKATMVMHSSGLISDIVSSTSSEKVYRWRIGGAERLEVHDDQVHISNKLDIQGGHNTVGTLGDADLNVSGGVRIMKDLYVGADSDNSPPTADNMMFFDSSARALGIGTATPSGHFSGAKIDIESLDGEVSEVRAMGAQSQGSGRFYAGQSNLYGGGFHYNGDNIPAMVGNTDRIVHYRRNNNSDYPVFEYPVARNNVTFNGMVRTPPKEYTMSSSAENTYVNLEESNVFVIIVPANMNNNNVLKLNRPSADGVSPDNNNGSDQAGGAYTFIIKNQGDKDINFDSQFYFTGGEPTISSGGSSSTPKIDILSGIWDGTNMYCAYNYNLEPAS
jgi:hypothetical protein